MSIVTITGASGAGKTSCIRGLLALPDWSLVTSDTTRSPRSTDLPGEYQYVPPEEFAVGSSRYLWVVERYGHSYATVIERVRRAAVGHGLHLMPIGPDVVANFEAHWWAIDHYVPSLVGRMTNIYLLSPEEQVLRVRLQRRRERGEVDDVEIERRIDECRTWDEAALASDTPFLFVPGEMEIRHAVAFIARLVARQRASIEQGFVAR